MTAPSEGRPPLGATLGDGGVRFRVWAPAATTVDVVFDSGEETVRLQRDEDGMHSGDAPGVGAGARYRYRLDEGEAYPDPASRFQPEGVHGPSEVVDPSYGWTDDGWRGLDRDNVAIYELHIGTFTPEGTYRAAAERLEAVADLGVDAVQVMPVADFPGERNWGYDGVSLFAPSRAYGRPEEFRSFVDRAHALGLGVILDVVYNHFGPDGAYHSQFSPYYFTERHHTPWGAAINLDGEGSEQVRGFFLEHASHWLHEYHVDGFRLDAVHTLIDESPTHFLAEYRTHTAHHRREGQPAPFLIAEEHRNLDWVVRPQSEEGYGFDVTYSDDWHHEVHSILTRSREGFLVDYEGTLRDLATATREGWIYSGQYSRYAGVSKGTDPTGLEPPPQRRGSRRRSSRRT